MQESASPPQPTREEIAALAYQLWEQNGRPDNQDVPFWLQAEQTLRTAAPVPPASTASAEPPATAAAAAAPARRKKKAGKG